MKKDLWRYCLVFLILLTITVTGCSGRQAVAAEETGAAGEIDVTAAELVPPAVQKYLLSINLADFRAELYLDNIPVKPGSQEVTAGFHTLRLQGEGIKEKELELLISKDQKLFLKSDPLDSRLSHLQTVKVGSLPKGMEFSLDGKYLFVALLGEPVVAVLDGYTLEPVKMIKPEDKKYWHEFVEIGVSPLGDAILASQMSTGSVHKIPLAGEAALEITESVAARGNWSKVVAFSKDGKMFAVSNWTSNDVTFFSYPQMEYLGKVKTPGIPRGLVFADGDKSLYVSNYSTGALHRIDVDSLKLADTIPGPKKGALRHLALDEERQILYASEMMWRRINVYDLAQKKLLKQIVVDSNPNTIALSPDRKYLFVSCRGPNSKDGYLERSPRSGRLYLIDCQINEVLEYRVLGNQPTALAVHPSGEFVAVSNFRDKNIEVFRVDSQAEDQSNEGHLSILPNNTL